MSVVWAMVLVVLLLLSWIATILGMPGNWLTVLATALYAAFIPKDSPAAIGWGVVVALLTLAILGEMVERTCWMSRTMALASRPADSEDMTWICATASLAATGLLGIRHVLC